MGLATCAVPGQQTAPSGGGQDPQQGSSSATHFLSTVLEAEVKRPPGLMPSRTMRLGEDAHSVTPLNDSQAEHFFPMDGKGNSLHSTDREPELNGVHQLVSGH